MKLIPFFILILISTTVVHAEPTTQSQEQNSLIEIQSIKESVRANQKQLSVQKEELSQQHQLSENLANALNETKDELSSGFAVLQRTSLDSHKAVTSIEQMIRTLKEQMALSTARIDQQSTQLEHLTKNSIVQEKMLHQMQTELNATLEQQAKKIVTLEALLAANKVDFTQQIEAINLAVSEAHSQLGTLGQDMSGKVKTLGYWVALVALIGGIGVVLGMAVRKKLSSSTDQLEDNLSQVRHKMEEENVQLDSKMVELLQGQMKLAEEQKSVVAANSGSEEIDHSLQLKVGEEIFRMRQRLRSLPDDIKGLKPLMKSLERLEDEFNQKGYELVDMLGKPFNDGLNVQARFVASDDLNPGERIINKIIKPQINFNGVSIQVADIEVITGG